MSINLAAFLTMILEADKSVDISANLKAKY